MTDEASAQPRLSVVVPIFNEAATIRQIVDQVQSALSEFSFEVILVDDGSTDGTTQLVQELAQKHASHCAVPLKQPR